MRWLLVLDRKKIWDALFSWWLIHILLRWVGGLLAILPVLGLIGGFGWSYMVFIFYMSVCQN